MFHNTIFVHISGHLKRIAVKVSLNLFIFNLITFVYYLVNHVDD